MPNCPDCGAECGVCPDCGGALCAHCHQRYEVRQRPLICWRCQATADQEWIAGGMRLVPRHWPRSAPPVLVASDQLPVGDRVDLYLCDADAATPDLAWRLTASRTLRPAKSGRAYTLHYRGGPVVAVRAANLAAAIAKANELLGGIV